MGESVHKTVTLGCMTACATIRTLYVHVVLNCVIFCMILFPFTPGTFYQSSFFFLKYYFNKLHFCNL